jgi:hypothetical protein
MMSFSPRFECGTKRYCVDMANCDEATFFMTSWGLPKLDGDRDGIPCERLWKPFKVAEIIVAAHH